MEQMEIDRAAIQGVYKKQNLDALIAAVARGEWTNAEAARAHVLFMESALLQKLVNIDVMGLEEILKGQVH